MPAYLYLYAPNLSSGEDLLGFDTKDPFTESYRVPTKERLQKMPTLFYASSAQKLPLGYLPNAVEEDARIHFKEANWDLIAGRIYQDELLDFLLVKKEDRHFALLLDAKSLLIKAEIHGEVAIKEWDKAESLKEYMEELGLVYAPLDKPTFGKKKPLDLGYAPLPKEEEEEELDQNALSSIVAPSFEANKKQNFAKNPFKEESEEEEQEPTIVDVSSIKPSFQGNSNKKPKKI